MWKMRCLIIGVLGCSGVQPDLLEKNASYRTFFWNWEVFLGIFVSPQCIRRLFLLLGALNTLLFHNKIVEERSLKYHKAEIQLIFQSNWRRSMHETSYDYFFEFNLISFDFVFFIRHYFRCLLNWCAFLICFCFVCFFQL